MVQADTPHEPKIVRRTRPSRTSRPAATTEASLLMMRIKELDREFARQTKQLTALTKRFSKKIAGMPADKTNKPKK